MDSICKKADVKMGERTQRDISNQLDKASDLIQLHADENQNWITGYLTPNHKMRILEDCILVDSLIKTQEAKILDMGSAPFYTALTLQHMGYDLKSTDIDPNRFGSLLEKINLDVIQCDFEIEKLPFEDDSFDVILLSEVFEHLRIDLIFTISEIQRVLKPDGKFILTSPNFFDYQKLKKLFTQGVTSNVFNAYKKKQDAGHMGHVREYTRNDVILFLEAMDFDIYKSFYRGIHFKQHWLKKLFPFLRHWFVIIASKKTP